MIDKDFFITFEPDSRYEKSAIEEFKKDCERYFTRNITIDDSEKVKALALFFSRHIKRNMYEEYKDHSLFEEFLEAYDVTKDDMQKIAKKIEQKNLSTIKVVLSQAKTELPMQLMNLLEVEMGGVIKSNGDPMTTNEYVAMIGMSREKAQSMINDAKEIVKQKVKRRGFEINDIS